MRRHPGVRRVLRTRLAAVVPLLLLLPRAALAQERPGLGAHGGKAAIESAVADFTARRYDEAQTAFRALHDRDPGAGDVLMYLGRLALLRGDDDGAVQWLERAVRADGDDARYHHWLGRAYAQEALHAGLLRRARLAGRIKSAFERAVELDPTQIEARLDVLRFYVAAPGIVGGSVRAAREQARAIAGLDPMWGHIARGLIAEKEKDAALAEREYRAAIASHADRAAPYHALGAMYQREGRFADAFAIYASLRAALPAETSVLYQIGRTASISGDELEAGTRALTRYLEIPTVEGTPLPASAHYRLALIHERRGLYVEATRELERAVRLEPDRDDVREALERLRRRPSSTSAAISPLCSGPATAHTAEVPAAQIRWSAPVTPSTCLPNRPQLDPPPFVGGPMHDAPGVLRAAEAMSLGRRVGGDETAVVLPFLVRLKRVPLATWMRASLPLADGPDDDDFDSPLSAAARARLRAIVEHMPSGVNFARSRVHDYVAVAEGFAPPVVVMRMKRVALTAALALLARPHLSAAEFDRLYGPFATLIPPSELGLSPG